MTSGRSLALALFFLLLGCVGQAPAPVSDACGWDRLIHPAQTDTIETLRQVDAHNKALRAACPGLT